MKNRVTLTIDPEIVRKAKKIAHVRRTSVSALIEDLLRQTPVASHKEKASFVEAWTGKFRLKDPVKPDSKLAHLKKHCGIEDG